jgi:hypothetical protein
MSMSTHVLGFRPPDEKWRKMKAAWDACEAAGLSIPPEVAAFFGHEAPDESGVEVNIKSALTRYSRECADGYEVDLTKLPKDLTRLRFYNSY